MPTYDYRCTKCQTQFQAKHAMNGVKPDCPHCGNEPDKVILCAPAVHGSMAQGRKAAESTFEKQESMNSHGPGCPCCH